MGNTTEKPKILIVDDHTDEIHILWEELHKDYEVFAATDGQQALDRVAADPPDLILLDVVMPGMNGHEVCQRLKANESTHDIPIIFITAKGDVQDETEGFALGALDYISKPFRLAVVRARVETILKLKKEMDLRQQLADDLQSLNLMLEDKVEEQVAELRLAHEKVKSSEATLRVILENILDLVFMTDGEGNFTFICGNTPNLIGYSVQELQAMGNVASLIDDATSTLDTLKEQGILHDIEKIIIDKRGNQRIFLINVNSVPFEESKQLWTCREITERKKLETRLRQAYKMEAIGTLAGGIAHDFNNILSAILGYTEISLSNLEAESQIKKFLSRIIEACTRAKDLVKHILMFSRETEQECRPITIALPVKEALRLIKASVPKNIDIRKNINSKAIVMADPTQIHQLVMNLCTNAAHAMKKNGGILTIELMDQEIANKHSADYPDLPKGLYTKMSVTDTGHGIPPQILDRIFDPFFTTKEKSEGTGMGLSVVHGIIKNHNGAVYVDSEVDKGTSFDIFLPNYEGETITKEKFHEIMVPKGHERILFIDDEEMIVEIGRAMLNLLGYHTVTQTSPEDALTLFTRDPDAFDLVITDLSMPKLTGLDIAERMREVRPDILILLCTGFGLELTDETVAKYGISGIIHKPILKRDMANKIRSILDSKAERTNLKRSE